MLPDPLREWLDRQDEGERRGALRTLRRVDRESGWADAVGAMPTTLESTGGAGTFAAKIPAPTEQTDASQTGTKISNGLAAPRPARTEATVVGRSCIDAQVAN